MTRSFVNFLRWKDVPRTSRIFCPKIAIFPQFQVYSNITQKAKQIINLLLLNNFYLVISYRRVEKESDELLYTRLVTRYGPRTNSQRRRLTEEVRIREPVDFPAIYIGQEVVRFITDRVVSKLCLIMWQWMVLCNIWKASCNIWKNEINWIVI